MNKVLFRANAGPGIGLGHLHRSLALAAVLTVSDVESVFLLNEDTPSLGWVREQGFPVVSLGHTESWTEVDSLATEKTASIAGCDAVVVDDHEAGGPYLARLREAGMYVIARDDLALHPFPCKMVINGNADAESLPYSSVSGDTSYLLGPSYIVLKEEFWKPVSPRLPECVGNVLLILGGTDQYELMPEILRLLDEVAGDFSVTAVVGPYFHNAEAVEVAASRARRSTKVISSPRDVCSLMLEADLAISAAGQTLYELAAVGCPTIAVAVASNQLGQLRALADAGTVAMAGDATSDKDVMDGIGSTVNALLADANARNAMSVTGQQLVDGQGAKRVAAAIRAASGSER